MTSTLMKINAIPRMKARRGTPVKAGNVYATKQGLNGYFVVVAVAEHGKYKPYTNVIMLRFDMAGNIIRAVCEPEPYVQNHKDLVGEVDGPLPDLTVKWYND